MGGQGARAVIVLTSKFAGKISSRNLSVGTTGQLEPPARYDFCYPEKHIRKNNSHMSDPAESHHRPQHPGTAEYTEVKLDTTQVLISMSLPIKKSHIQFMVE